jgi:hypothetical protein
VSTVGPSLLFNASISDLMRTKYTTEKTGTCRHDAILALIGVMKLETMDFFQMDMQVFQSSKVGAERRALETRDDERAINLRGD